ncbi:MAG: carbon monoxide dehydrogenase [Actinobacteria bacterium]|nr:MAG: carbon monoxide dehydrogenase [Actinomycetota bacterium]
MQLENEFRVEASVDRVWQVLTDLERIAPCMPGAQLQEVEGDEHRGIVKVKVGPITAQYKGVARIVDRDREGGRLVLRAEGRETRGQGNASALITARLAADGDATAVAISTDLTVTGKVAQFGRGVLADVSAKLVTQFVECLEADVLAGEEAVPAPAPAAVPAASVPANGDGEQVRRIESAPSPPVDLMGAAGVPVAKRVAPVVALLFVTMWLVRRRRRRRRARG